jgi:hypothetical protein
MKVLLVVVYVLVFKFVSYSQISSDTTNVSDSTALENTNFGISNELKIAADVYDSIAPNQYNFRIVGNKILTDSMELEIQLRDLASDSIIIFSASKFMNTVGNGSFNAYAYNDSTHVFSIQLGVFSDLDKIVHVRIKKNGSVEEEVILRDLYRLKNWRLFVVNEE